MAYWDDLPSVSLPSGGVSGFVVDNGPAGGGDAFSLGGVGDALNSVGSFFETLWDKSQGIINRIADVELLGRELDLYQTYQANRAAIERANDPARYPTISTASLMPIVLIGGAILIGYVLLKE